MSGGKHRSLFRVVQESRKGVILSKDERDTAMRLRGVGRSWEFIARAIGRSIPDLRSTFDPTWGKSG